MTFAGCAKGIHSARVAFGSHTIHPEPPCASTADQIFPCASLKTPRISGNEVARVGVKLHVIAPCFALSVENPIHARSAAQAAVEAYSGRPLSGRLTRGLSVELPGPTATTSHRVTTQSDWSAVQAAPSSKSLLMVRISMVCLSIESSSTAIPSRLPCAARPDGKLCRPRPPKRHAMPSISLPAVT